MLVVTNLHTLVVTNPHTLVVTNLHTLVITNQYNTPRTPAQLGNARTGPAIRPLPDHLKRAVGRTWEGASAGPLPHASGAPAPRCAVWRPRPGETLFPVIVITGNKEPNKIKDLAKIRGIGEHVGLGP